MSQEVIASADKLRQYKGRAAAMGMNACIQGL